jgi:hypothetical protein
MAHVVHCNTLRYDSEYQLFGLLVRLATPTAFSGVGGISDKPSDNGSRQPRTQRD